MSILNLFYSCFRVVAGVFCTGGNCSINNTPSMTRYATVPFTRYFPGCHDLDHCPSFIRLLCLPESRHSPCFATSFRSLWLYVWLVRKEGDLLHCWDDFRHAF